MKMPWEISAAAVDKADRIVIVGRRIRDITTRARSLARYLGSPCPYCGVTLNRDKGWNSPQAPSRDHRVPLSRGGLNVAENIIICCRGCNEDKGSLRPEEYLAVRAGLASRLDRRWIEWLSIVRNPLASKKALRRLEAMNNGVFAPPRGDSG
jgi:5-methylcytosine-specific restriction endonuclease McrA